MVHNQRVYDAYISVIFRSYNQCHPKSSSGRIVSVSTLVSVTEDHRWYVLLIQRTLTEVIDLETGFGIGIHSRDPRNVNGFSVQSYRPYAVAGFRIRFRDTEHSSRYTLWLESSS